jgi:hypothetical protein
MYDLKILFGGIDSQGVKFLTQLPSFLAKIADFGLKYSFKRKFSKTRLQEEVVLARGKFASFPI